MKKIIIILILVLSYTGFSMAQSSMTDDQIMEFVVSEQQAGTTQSQIVTKLMQKGVTVTQIQRIRSKYERQKNNSGLGGLDADINGKQGRMRTNNGKTKQETEKQKRTTSGRIGGFGNDMTVNSEDYDRMNVAVGQLYGDSLNYNEDRTYEEFMNWKNRPKVFGHDIFNNKDLTFEPNMNIATPQNYRLGPGDAVFIDIYGASQKTVEETISPDGTVTIEGFGPVSLSGLTVDQANAKLRSTLGARYSSSSVKLTVGQTRTIMVNVMGEVKTPGTFTLSAFATVFHALYMAGGINDIGTLRNIKVFRQGRLVTQVDVYDYILNGKLTGNVRLADNDVIVVGAYDCLVTVAGKVKRPMIYEMKKNESVQTLLKYSGGFASDAYTQSVRVNRKTGKQYAVFNVTEFDMSSFHVSDGDSVTVDSILPRYENTVEVKGAVFRPGMYQLGEHINSVRSLIEACDGVTEQAFTQHAVMHRMKKDRTLEVLSVDIKGIMNGTVADVPLRNEDVLYIPTNQSVQEEQTISIHGEVQFPGIYQYADNETVEDFILQAGGLNAAASTMKVDVSRRVNNPVALTTDSIIAKTFTMQIKDGFVIDGEKGFILMPFDEVYVRKNPDYNKQQNVTIEGEVNFAGDYTMDKRDLKLTDIIKRAGGLTLEARADGARLERRYTDQEKMRIEQQYRKFLSKGGSQDSLTFNMITKKVEKVRRYNPDTQEYVTENELTFVVDDYYQVGIDLAKAMKTPGGNYDIQLREGDRITVPRFNGTVKITGAVMYPNTLSYTQGKSAKWYVKRAGGWGNTAKKNAAYIVRQNGMVESITSRTRVTPGSEIVVPEKVKKQNGAQNIALIVSSISALATVGAVAVSALK